MEITDERKQKVWNELIKEARKKVEEQTKLPDEKTIKDLMAEVEIPVSYEMMRRIVETKVKEGKFKRRTVIVDGRRTNYYSPV